MYSGSLYKEETNMTTIGKALQEKSVELEKRLSTERLEVVPEFCMIPAGVWYAEAADLGTKYGYFSFGISSHDLRADLDDSAFMVFEKDFNKLTLNHDYIYTGSDGSDG